MWLSKLSKRALSRCGLTLALLLISGFAFAEGSRSLHPSGATGSRAVMETSGTGVFVNQVIRRQFLYVYAQQGEYILLGSSNRNNGGNIFIYNPQSFGNKGNETIPGSANFTCSSQAGRGVIANRNQELAGPNSADGTVTVPNGFNPCWYQAPQTGIYGVRFTSATTGTATNNASIDPIQILANGVSAWDVTVRTNASSITDLNGRVFTYAWAVYTEYNNRPISANLFYASLDGYRYQQTFRGIDPNGATFYANAAGFLDSNGGPLYHDLRGSDAQVTAGASYTAGATAQRPQYPIFFSNISPTGSNATEAARSLSALGIPLVPATPELTNPIFVGNVSGKTSTVAAGGTFTFSTLNTLTYEIVISRDGIDFDPANTQNRVLTGVALSGNHSVLWDGRDNNGTPFPASVTPYKFQIYGRNGEIHFPMIDVEGNSGGGPTLTKLNGSLDSVVYYDDRGYRTANGSTVGTLNGHLCGGTAGNGQPQPSPVYSLLGIDTLTTLNYRNWTLNGNQNADCANTTTQGFGDAKGLDLWALERSDRYEEDLNIVAATAGVDVGTMASATSSVISNGTAYGSFTFNNAGDASATGTTYSVTIGNPAQPNTCPAAVTFTTVPSGVVATYSPAPACTVSFTNMPTTLTAGTTLTFNFNYTVAPTNPGPIPVTTTIAATNESNNIAPNTASATTTVAQPAINVVKSASPSSGTPIVVGTTITYTLTATITDAPLTSTLTLTDTLGTGLTFGSVSSSSVAFTCSGSLTCTLPSGTSTGTYVVTYTATVNSSAAGSVANQVVATGGSPNLPTCDSCRITLSGDPRNLTGHVFSDTNNNGIQDGSEPSLVGISVTVTDSTGTPHTVTTDANGDYSVNNIPFGIASAVVTAPNGYSVSTTGSGGTATQSISNSSTNAITVGLYAPASGTGSLTGHVFSDTNNNGIQDGVEPNLAGVSVTVTDATGISHTVTTNASGYYTVASLSAGTATIDVDAPAGYTVSTGNDPQSVAISNGASTTAPDVGLYAPASAPGTGSLTGHVFSDTNNNGIQDGVEPDLAGVSVTVTDATGTSHTVTTNASGDYTVASLSAGTATIDVNAPAGYTVSTGNDPQSVAISNGVPTTAPDVGLYAPASGTGSLTGHVFSDTNNNGIQDGVEPNLAGVSVTVTDATGISHTVTTNASGDYTVASLSAGTATIDVDAPAGYTVSTGNDPQSVAISNGASTTAPDVGLYAPASAPGTGSLTGHVFSDTDGNGSQDAGEPNLSGITVTVTGSDGTLHVVTTDSNGDYTFSNLPQGNATVDITVPNGYSVTTNNNPQLVAIGSSGTTTATEVGLQPAAGSTGTLSGHVFSDTNNNGTQDAGEPSLTDITVTVTDSANVPHVLTTDASGNYSVSSLPLGTTTAVVTVPAGYTISTTASNGTAAQSLTLASGSNSTADVGLYAPASGTSSLSGHVFSDTNNNGIQDGVEPNLAGVSVTVTDATGTSHTVTTNASGYYTVASLSAGTATIDVDAPAGYTVSTGNNPQSVAISNGVPTTAPDVGLYAPASAPGTGSLTGHVFSDTDGNGSQDAGEPNLSGITVTVTDSDGTLHVVTTDSNGDYTFSNLPQGNASVDITVPNGYSVTTNNNPQLVAIGSSGTTTATEVGLQPATGSTGTLNGHVFSDTNNNDTQDAGEPSLAGITVTITDSANVPHVVITDANGDYTLSGLPLGTTTAVVTVPAGYNVSTTANGGTASQVTLLASGNNTMVTTGFAASTANPVGTGQLSGTVFNDLDGDGVQDPGEPAFANATVTLTDANGTIYHLSTDSNGQYSQSGLPAGLTSVTVSANGYSVTTSNNTQTLVLVDGGNLTAELVGLHTQAAAGTAGVTGHVFNDVNGNGVQDASEGNFANVTVTISNAGGTLATLTTDASGNYSTSGLPAGVVTVTVNPVSGYHFTTGSPTQTLTLTANTTTAAADEGLQLDAGPGNTGSGAALGYVFFDTNGDGIHNPGEPFIGGATVIITDANGVQHTVTSQNNGSYFIDGLATGTATVQIVPLNGFTVTTYNTVQTITIYNQLTTTVYDVGMVIAPGSNPNNPGNGTSYTICTPYNS